VDKARKSYRSGVISIDGVTAVTKLPYHNWKNAAMKRHISFQTFLIMLLIVAQGTTIAAALYIRDIDKRSIRNETMLRDQELSLDAARRACYNLNEMKAATEILVIAQLNQPLPKGITGEQREQQKAYRAVLQSVQKDRLSPANCRKIR
jgi:hypothetical protein